MKRFFQKGKEGHVFRVYPRESPYLNVTVDGRTINAGLKNVNKGFHDLAASAVLRRYTP